MVLNFHLPGKGFFNPSCRQAPEDAGEYPPAGEAGTLRPRKKYSCLRKPTLLIKSLSIPCVPASPGGRYLPQVLRDNCILNSCAEGTGCSSQSGVNVANNDLKESPLHQEFLREP